MTSVESAELRKLRAEVRELRRTPHLQLRVLPAQPHQLRALVLAQVTVPAVPAGTVSIDPEALGNSPSGYEHDPAEHFARVHAAVGVRGGVERHDVVHD